MDLGVTLPCMTPTDAQGLGSVPSSPAAPARGAFCSILVGHPCPPWPGRWLAGWGSVVPGRGTAASGGRLILYSAQSRGEETRALREAGVAPRCLAKGHSVATVTSVCTVKHTQPSHFSRAGGFPAPIRVHTEC